MWERRHAQLQVLEHALRLCIRESSLLPIMELSHLRGQAQRKAAEVPVGARFGEVFAEAAPEGLGALALRRQSARLLEDGQRSQTGARW